METVDLTTAVNFAVGVALLILAISMALLTGYVVPLLRQVNATVMSVQKLSETMEREVVPTMTELRSVMDGVNQIKSITAQRVQDVSNKAGELTGNVSTLVSSAKKESTVASVGVLACLKAYLFSNEASRREQKMGSKSIPMTRDENNV